jgi:hypothetical protein
MSYLVCDKCGGYYELQSNEFPEDFTDKCECGGHLRYVQDLNDDKKLQKVCPNCGSVIEDEDVVCPACDFRLKELSEGQIIFGFLWLVPNICLIMIGAIIVGWMSLLVILDPIFNPQSLTDVYSYLIVSLIASIFTIGLVIPDVVLIRRFKSKYLSRYDKKNLNWVAISAAFIITMLIYIFGERYLPSNVSLVGPLIGGLIAGCIVNESYIDGLVNGGIPAGIAGFIGFILLILLYWEIPTVNSLNITSVTLSFAIGYFAFFFVIGSIGGIIGAGIRKRISSSKDTAKEIS